MRHYIKYFTLLSAILAVSCQKQVLPNEPADFEGGLVTFSTFVKTKAGIVNDLNNKTFGVYGYSFSNLTNWGTAQAQAKPNVFHNLGVECGTNGECEYDLGDNPNDATIKDGLKKWDFNQRYSFFAYYPYNVSNIAVSGSNEANTPYITYTLPNPVNNKINTVDLWDVVTAKNTNYNPAISGTIVDLEFNHRLFCLDLYGHNFNENDINISDVKVTISGIKYNKSQIFLDRDRTVTVHDEAQDKDIVVKRPSIPSKTSDWAGTATFELVELVTLKGGAEAKTTPLNGDNHVMLIPQDYVEGEDGLHIKVSFKLGSETIECEATYKKDFAEGQKYTLTVNFIGAQVALVKGEAADWDWLPVYHTFD